MSNDKSKYLCEIYWLFFLTKYGIYKINHFHDCCSKKVSTLNKYGEEVINTEISIIKPFHDELFYGCIKCGKYHFCESSKSCPVIITNEYKVCIFSGKVVSNVDMVMGKFKDEMNFKDEAIISKDLKKGVIVIKKRALPEIKGNKTNYYQNNPIYSNKMNHLNDSSSNLLIFPVKKEKNDAKSIADKEKLKMKRGNKNICEKNIILDDFDLKESSDSKESDLDYYDNNLSNPVYIDSKKILNKYFLFIEEMINVISQESTCNKKNCKNNNQLIEQSKHHIIINNNNLCLTNGFFQKFDQKINQEIESIMSDLNNIDQMALKLDKTFKKSNETILNFKEFYKIIIRIIGLIYDSPWMNYSIQQFKTKSKDKNINFAKKILKLDMDYKLIIATKIIDIQKICNSLFFDLFIENFYISDYQGFNILIWGKIPFLIQQRSKELMILDDLSHKGYKTLFNRDYSKTSNLIISCLKSYPNPPLWLKSKIHDNIK
jgi:hypothetical protein